MDISELYEVFKHSTGVTTDTRNIQHGQIYFALKGEHFNGNTFAHKAIENGAAYCVIDEAEYKLSDKYILTSDVLSTLQELSYLHRKKINPMAVVGVTGSNGKTTTKELLYAVLSTTFKTHATKGNLNNHIGIPLTLLAMDPDTEIAIIEMGANHKKEIESYCKYAEPTHGIITNCGKAHLEGFGGIEDIRKAKGELYDYIKNNFGNVFVNGDDDILLDMLKERGIENYTSYGSNTGNTYMGKMISDQPFVNIQFENTEIHSQMFGSYNYSNMMCAIAVGKYFGVTNNNLKTAIENYAPANARSQVIEKNGFRMILDAYNANPTSMEHALESFSKLNAQQKIVILGDMFELGENSLVEHQSIADLCLQLNFDTVVLVGKDFSKTKTPGQVLKFINSDEAQTWFRQQDLSGANILLKGSRSMQMEKVIA
ncbi:MAG: UDP-N-acetylmuramoyl-tripeptide--D-alanyl-D-alanine ligase [Bacteroidota bacterium]|nr:UDP-N-acetylmuramoyl-tripeptide--D-alanyl-D-alanine ligase [Bacteroidota bacterium]